jgi:hypothetical protein
MIWIHAVLIHLLLLLVEGVGVHSSLVLLLLAVADVAHGLRPPQVLVAVLLGLESLRVVLEGLGESLTYFLVDLVTHVVEPSVHIHVLVILFFRLPQLDHVHN